MGDASIGCLLDLSTGERESMRLSTVQLDNASDVKRRPKYPERERPEKFLASFDFTTLYYDCFWDQNTKDVLCVGPTPTNLRPHFKRAVYRALPSGKQIKAKHFFSLTVMSTQLKDVPVDTTAIEMHFAGEPHLMPVQPNGCDEFSRENLMFTLSKNNDLKWIKFWAEYHVRKQNVSAIILFDNGSDQYEMDDLIKTLTDIDGLKKVLVVSMPYPYCAKDEILRVNPYWAHFLQIALMSIVLRRFGMGANAILNLDIDELANSNGQADVFQLAEQSSLGILAMKGVWVEPIAESEFGDHRDFCVVAKNKKQSHCYGDKWAIDPKRKWYKKLKVFPYMHWIENRPQLGRRYVEGVHFWHFKGINTNWKLNRATPMQFDPEIHERRNIEF
ncbi:hypothetical protein MXMO3_03339 [Maritalea myrionectae]|uniref:Glycosyltransferase family 92 protein n=1 Tax=Maritalea myrionectae TaxID=454601 RepID=A0A2R4MIV0_9HYPH|nr:hypothetical protein [Maritalea myrionectae]AVX05844.1 hypothetical protein MXMO3_03339 [Maritalea myrionectae]